MIISVDYVQPGIDCCVKDMMMINNSAYPTWVMESPNRYTRGQDATRTHDLLAGALSVILRKYGPGLGVRYLMMDQSPTNTVLLHSARLKFMTIGLVRVACVCV